MALIQWISVIAGENPTDRYFKTQNFSELYAG